MQSMWELRRMRDSERRKLEDVVEQSTNAKVSILYSSRYHLLARSYWGEKEQYAVSYVPPFPKQFMHG